LLFMATLVHTPEQCFGRKENAAEGKRWVENMESLAKKTGVKILGAYICPNEHTFYFILETDDFGAVSEFLSPPMLTHHSAHISPIIPLKKAFGQSYMKKMK